MSLYDPYPAVTKIRPVRNDEKADPLADEDSSASMVIGIIFSGGGVGIGFGFGIGAGAGVGAGATPPGQHFSQVAAY